MLRASTGTAQNGQPGPRATAAQLERYLLELQAQFDPRGETAFVREEVIRQIAALRHARRRVR